MTTPVRCEECDGRGWKIVTRRGHVAASKLGVASSSTAECLFCDGAECGAAAGGEVFEWEVRVQSGGSEALGSCGSSPFQATAMDELRKAMRSVAGDAAVCGRIIHSVYGLGGTADGESRHEVFRAYLDTAGSVRFERVAE